MSQEVSQFKVSDFYNKLAERVSGYNARLLLNSALLDTGCVINEEKEDKDFLEAEVAKNLCLELIKKGGPAFQVGKDIYPQI